MIIVNTPDIPTHQISEILGIVRGSTVRARNAGQDILAGFKNMMGGEITQYTRLLATAREEALRRMSEDAMRLGADAIVNVRFTTSAVAQGAAEILVYGTAVKLDEGYANEQHESFSDHTN
jgi:uncharacterized protein YbjQ (UPF0145 family)